MSNTLDWLQQADIFAHASHDYLTALSTQAQTISHDKGHVLFIQDDPAERFYIVTKGWIKLYRETRDGDQAVIDIIDAGTVFAHTSVFENYTYPYTAEATEKGEVISLPLSVLDQAIKDDTNIAKDILATLAKHNAKQTKELEHRTLQNAPQRIGCFLLGLLPNKNQNTAVVIDLPYEKTLIAARLGMQPETFSRALNKLKAATDITIEKSHINIPSIQKLSSFSCTACTSEFPCKDK